MKNFIFVSPDFPDNYWRFCRCLKDDGFNVLGIGDRPYNELPQELIASLTEYYKVPSLENYGEVYRAVAFFAFKYGRIDFIESNNEYWLEQDARLRTDFNVGTGFTLKDVKKIKLKSEMKKYYKKAGINTARFTLAKSPAACRKFIAEVGYPVIVKPDNGVGASSTHKLSSDAELAAFLKDAQGKNINYIMEEYVDGEVQSYDAVIDGSGNPLFETGNITPKSVMDVVNNADDCLFYIVKELAEDIREAGRRAVKAFGVKSRFIHFEFFRLLSDGPLGKKGELAGLEVNMRPSGGVSPEMINFANSVDVYKIYADAMAYGKTGVTAGKKYFCGFAGRRDAKKYRYSHGDIIQKYGAHVKMSRRVPAVLSGTMGDYMYLGAFDGEDELKEFYAFVTLRA